MFPSMEIFLMRVPSGLAAGDGQLLLGGVAMPRLVAAPSASGREGWEVAKGVRCGGRHRRGARLELQALWPAGTRV